MRRSSIISVGLLATVAVLVTTVLFVRPLAGAAPVADRDTDEGKALFTRQCAGCHGAEGRGDGPSAGGFATKPADLTDGRVMNPLPAALLVNVIPNGGPGEGLAPTMPAFDKFLNFAQTQRVVKYVRSLAQPPRRPEQEQPIVPVPRAPAQPIFFSHLIHATSFGIACQYCHADARRSEYAGIPSTDRCLGCHRIIGAQDNPEIRKIHAYAQDGRPIPWVRVFKVPEFTYFPHKAHVRANVECQRCHGPVERMRVVGAQTGPRLANDLTHLVGLRPGPPPLSMGWCVDCHRAENAKNPAMKAPLDCVTCHH